MVKLTLEDILSSYSSAAKLNANNELIEIALDNTLSRDGTGPNEMNASIDMNSNQLLNLAEPTSSANAATKNYVDQAILNVSIGSGSGSGGGDVDVPTIDQILDALDIGDADITPTGQDTATNLNTLLAAVDTLEDLENLSTTTFSAGSRVYVKGRTSTNDGYQDNFVWIPDDVSTIISPAGTHRRPVQSVASNQLTAANHGWKWHGIAFTPSATSLGLTKNEIYYARIVDANTLTVHPTFWDARNNTNIISVSGTPASSFRLRRLSDAARACFVCPAVNRQGTGGMWIRESMWTNSQGVNAKWFLVKGDSATDCTQGLQQALAFCGNAGFNSTYNTNNSTLILPNGNCYVRGELYVETAITIKGKGRVRSNITIDPSVTDSFNVFYVPIGLGVAVVFQDFAIVGSKATVAGGTHTGIYLQSAASYDKSILMFNMEIRDVTGDCLRVGTYRGTGEVTSSNFNNAGRNILRLEGIVDWRFIGGALGSAGEEVIWTSPTDNLNVSSCQFIGMNIYGAGENGGNYSTIRLGPYVNDFVFIGNQIDRSSGTAPVVQLQAALTTSSNSNIFIGNRLSRPGGTTLTVPYFDVSGTRGAVISHNIFEYASGLQATYAIYGDSATEEVSAYGNIAVDDFGVSPINAWTNGVSGIDFGRDVVTRTGTQTLTNKTITSPTLTGTVAGTPTIASAFTWSTAQNFPTNSQVNGSNIVNLTATQTLSNKTQSSPTITGTIAGTPTVASAWTWSTAQNFPTNSQVNGSNIVNLSATQTLTNKTLTAPALSGTITGSPTASGAWTFSNPVTVATPVLSTDAATKAYVDSISAGLHATSSVALATTANITLSGEQTIDGTLTSTSRVLVKNQTTASQNGIYVSAAGAWSRATDMDDWTEATAALVPVTGGSTNANTIFISTAVSGGTLGTNDLSFTTFITTSGLQPLDSDLTAIAALATTSYGRSVLTLADASAAQTLFGLVIGTNVQAYDSDLAALAANSTNGIWARTGSGTGSARTITGTSNEITVTNGDGVSGNPTLSIPSSVTFTGKTITGGTFASPTISGTIAGTPTVASALTWTTAQDFPTGTTVNANPVVTTTDTQTLTNKTLTSPTIGGTIAGTPTVASALTWTTAQAFPSGTTIGGASPYFAGGTDVALADGGTGRSLSDPNDDRIMFWDDSAGQVDWLDMPAAGLTTSGTTIALSNDLAALEALSSTGLAVRTSTDTWVQRDITTSTGITVSNGSGVAGNPTIGLDTTKVPQFVATYAALTALVANTGLVDNGIYCTYSRTTEEDGGYGFWRYDSASTATANGGTILAINGGGAGRFFRLGVENNVLDARWFGGSWNGSGDDVSAINNAIAALPVTGGTVRIPNTVAIATSIIMGDGTTSTVSTRNGIILESMGGAALDASLSGSSREGCKVTWIGSTSTTAAVLDIRGPIYGCQVRNIEFDCAGKAGIGVKTRWLYKCLFTNTTVTRYTTLAWDLRVHDVAYATFGVTYGYAENKFINCHALYPYIAATGLSAFTANAWFCGGGPNNNIAFSRNVFIGCECMYGGSSGSYAWGLYYADNNTWISCFALQASYFDAGADDLGVGVAFIAHTAGAYAGAFPLENSFFHSPVLGGMQARNEGVSVGAYGTEITDGGIGYNTVWGYCIGDGEPLPTNTRIKVQTHDGRLVNKWSGTLSYFMGQNDPGVGLTSAALHYGIQGTSAGSGSYGAYRSIMPSSGVLTKLEVSLSTAPGTSNGRTFTVYKNGSATALTVTYGAAESGIKTVSGSVSYTAGDFLSFLSDVTGTPTNTQGFYSVAYYPTEVV